MSPIIENAMVLPSGLTSRSSQVPSSVLKRTGLVLPCPVETSQPGLSAADAVEPSSRAVQSRASGLWRRFIGFPSGLVGARQVAGGRHVAVTQSGLARDQRRGLAGQPHRFGGRAHLHRSWFYTTIC